MTAHEHRFFGVNGVLVGDEIRDIDVCNWCGKVKVMTRFRVLIEVDGKAAVDFDEEVTDYRVETDNAVRDVSSGLRGSYEYEQTGEWNLIVHARRMAPTATDA